MGRSAMENDEVTFRLARGGDWWFHVEGMPSSHVVARVAKGKELSQDALLDAATLAAVHSKAKSNAVVEIKYTQCK
ncbi:MAG: NFACT RNA binding domain-containing protein, partial [Deltaproteobacteria bacterium]|nr:NFACT RNA binding domain-containing protein [Deltaproteobacteria bacterium]